jgi:hypothetical protein
MLWTTIPFLLAVIVLWGSTKIKIGDFITDESYNVLIPESVWTDFKILISVLLIISIPTFILTTSAKYKNKKGKRLYPNSKVRGWTSSMDDEWWSYFQSIAFVILFIVVLIILIFN